MSYCDNLRPAYVTCLPAYFFGILSLLTGNWRASGGNSDSPSPRRVYSLGGVGG